jgi:hypothetical protein
MTFGKAGNFEIFFNNNIAVSAKFVFRFRFYGENHWNWAGEILCGGRS